MTDKAPKRITEIELDRMNLPRRFWDARLDVMEPVWRDLAIKYYSKAFLVQDENSDKKIMSGKGLILYGGEGTGKTYIAAVIAKLLRMKEFMVYFLPAEEVNVTLHRRRFGKSETESIFERISTVDLLIVDDVNFSTDKQILYNLLKTRSENLLSTILVMRVRISELPIISENGSQKYDFKSYFGKYFSELAPIAQGSMLPVPVFGVNYREKELLEYARLMSDSTNKELE